MIHYKDIETVEHVETPLSNEMANALDDWYNMYLNKADWLKPETVKSLNLPAFISSEIARQIVLEMEWTITGKGKNGETQTEGGEDIMNPVPNTSRLSLKSALRSYDQAYGIPVEIP